MVKLKYPLSKIMYQDYKSKYDEWLHTTNQNDEWLHQAIPIWIEIWPGAGLRQGDV